MAEVLQCALALLAGGALGAFFFGGLWFTVVRGTQSPAAALWFLGSLLVRTGVTLAGFLIVSRGRWDRLPACLIGFLIARFAVRHLTRPAPPADPLESSHAS